MFMMLNKGDVFHMSPIRMSKIETPVRIVLEFNEAFNRHDVTGMMQLMSEDCVFENTDPAPDGTRYSGKEAVTQFWQDFFHESPQAHIDIEEVFGQGNNRCIIQLGGCSRTKRICAGSGYLPGEGWSDLGKAIVC